MKVLVVEDEQRIADYIKKGLELKSYIVDVSYNGEDGLAMAASENYDVIVLDRMLPQIDGLEICRQLRKQDNNTPILMLTAKTTVDDRVEGLDSGADDYLGKPFAFVELIARIKALARRPQDKITTTKLSSHGLTLDTKNYEVVRSGEIINLSKKEYALLEFMLRHQGQIFNAEQLAQQVWSYDSDVLANTAQVYIGYLRKKIDKAFPQEKPLIKTVRGFGYKLLKDQNV